MEHTRVDRNRLELSRSASEPVLKTNVKEPETKKHETDDELERELDLQPEDRLPDETIFDEDLWETALSKYQFSKKFL
jgi:hypothetical protein